MKVAIYVEGITEAAFVYQLICEHYNRDFLSFRIECLKLDPKEASNDLFNYGDEKNAPDYYLLYDSCSDGAVSSDIKDRIGRHIEEGYDKVVGLRDIYSENFKALYPHKKDASSIASFIKDLKDALEDYNINGLIHLRFAIMEIEAWLLAMSDVFCRVDKRLTSQWLLDKAQIDVSKDPETEYFHPYSYFENIYKSISKPYGKHWNAIKEIIFKLKQSDFETLYNSSKCNSFRDFHDAIFM